MKEFLKQLLILCLSSIMFMGRVDIMAEPVSGSQTVESLQPDGAKQEEVKNISEKLTPEPKVENLFSPQYGKLVIKDMGYVFSSPLHWRGKDWLIFGLGSSAVVVTAAFIDKPLQRQIQKHRDNTLDDIAKSFEPFGAEYSFGVLGAFELGGFVLNDDKAKAVAHDGLASSLIAGGIITPTLKFLFGRSRPNNNEGVHHFDPFSGNASFPSGHATQAFAVASVIAEHYDPLWIKIASYGLASMVGYARMEHNAHFASDVLAGALIGTAIGRAVVRFNRKKRYEVSLVVDRDTVGVKISHRF